MLFLRANVSMHFVERADKRVEFVSSVGNVLGTGNGDRRGRGGEGGSGGWETGAPIRKIRKSVGGNVVRVSPDYLSEMRSHTRSRRMQ